MALSTKVGIKRVGIVRFWSRLCKNEYLDDATNGLFGWQAIIF